MVHLIALSLLLQTPPASGTEAATALGFAGSLLAEGDAYRAIGEYKRFLYLMPDGPAADAARYAIGLAYLRGGQPQAAADEYQRLAERSSGLRAEALLQVGYAQYVAGQAPLASLALSRWLLGLGPSSPRAARERATYLLGWAELAQGRPERASARFTALEDFPGRPALLADLRGLEHLPSRSPLVAGLLSVVPGAGHLYIGQPAQAAAAFAWNAAFGFALYDSIHRGQVGVSIILGLLESIWYSGTLLGAVTGAQRFNRDARQNALDGLRATYDDRPESWPPAPPLAP